jgi:signal transduction histidine kinase
LRDPDQLLQSVVDLTKERFSLYHVHIYLADEGSITLLLAAGAGEVGKQMLAEGWSIPVEHPTSIVAEVARNRKFAIANDLFHDKDSVFLSNRLLPDTRSEMAVPMIVGEKLLGVFDVQSDVAGRFTNEDANIYATLAAQVGVALQNAKLYVEQAATVTQLRELDRLKSAFLANMSHELRTPLNSILGFSDVILEELDGPTTDLMQNDLQLIQKNGRHLLHLINDVLDMAKIDAGRMNLHPEYFRVHGLFEEVIGITSSLAIEKSLAVHISSKSSDQGLEIFADRTRIQQVMINLVNNAIKFTEKGEITIHANQPQNGHVVISVRDSGLGIPSNHLESIFQEFTQVDTSTTRKVGGTGLGLPISRRLIQLHGGRLWAESPGIPGEGSVFYIELPVEAKIAEPIEKQER